MQTVQLFIGSNNDTNELELDKIERILSNRFDGFTIQQARGYWLGKPENTAVVTIAGKQSTINNVIEELKTELHQEAIAVMPVTAMRFI